MKEIHSKEILFSKIIDLNNNKKRFRETKKITTIIIKNSLFGIFKYTIVRHGASIEHLQNMPE